MPEIRTDKDYYKTLGVTRETAPDDIKRAYRKIAVANHPDTHPRDKTAEATFKEASEAYDTLSDGGKRASYNLACDAAGKHYGCDKPAGDLGDEFGRQANPGSFAPPKPDYESVDKAREEFIDSLHETVDSVKEGFGKFAQEGVNWLWKQKHKNRFGR